MEHSSAFPFVRLRATTNSHPARLPRTAQALGLLTASRSCLQLTALRSSLPLLCAKSSASAPSGFPNRELFPSIVGFPPALSLTNTPLGSGRYPAGEGL